MLPKVSFLVVTYGHENYIEKCIRSIIDQTYTGKIEVVIGNDASPDQTNGLIETLRNEFPRHIELKYYLHDENLGGVRNFNFCMMKCTGDLIFVLDGDDLSDPERVEFAVTRYREKPYSLLISNAREIEESGKETGELRYRDSFDLDRITLADVYTNSVPVFGASYVIEKQVVDKFGEVDAEYVGRNNVDQILFWRALSLGGVEYVDQPLLSYRVHAGGASIQRSRNKAYEQGDEYKYRALSLKLTNNIICNLVYLLITFPEGINGAGRRELINRLRSELASQTSLIEDMCCQDMRGLQYSNEYYQRLLGELVSLQGHAGPRIRDDELANAAIVSAKNRPPTPSELDSMIEKIEESRNLSGSLSVDTWFAEAQDVIKVPVSRKEPAFNKFRNKYGKLDLDRLRKLQRYRFVHEVFIQLGEVDAPDNIKFELSNLIKSKQISKIDVLFAVAEFYSGFQIYRELTQPYWNLLIRLSRQAAVRRVKSIVANLGRTEW